MSELLGLGFSFILTSLSLLGGLLGGLLFFSLNQASNEKKGSICLYVLAGVIVVVLIGLIIVLASSGLDNIFKDITQSQNNQIFINLSCTDDVNCSAKIANQLQFSCQECPIQTPCPTMISNVPPNQDIFMCPPPYQCQIILK